MPREGSIEVRIDAETGSVTLPSDLELHPHGMVPTYWPSPLQLRATRDMSNGYMWHDVEGANFAGEPCIVQVCSFLNSIERINFDFAWDWKVKELWRDQAEVQRQIELARVQLRAALKRPFARGTERFRWGDAYSVYDDRSGGIPHIGLWFDPPPEFSA